MKAKMRPIVVDAWKLDVLAEFRHTPQWVIDAISSFRLEKKENIWIVYTNRGEKQAFEGDYLIKGKDGDLYPCEKEIFEDLYDILED